VITVGLTMGEAQAVADAIQELVERSEQNELVLGPIDWDDLRTAGDKLTKAIDGQSPTTMVA
jgi:alkanesulfonate monooxygenase SsuD/methylene tetrahydromethanopterin reductase-like flavin-dependent oxidoreductase (luciferase family)